MAPLQMTHRLSGMRVLLPIGWALAAVGYFGPWVGHRTAALTLSGADLGEFVKFLPSVLSGDVRISRLLFYLPPVAVVLGVALLTSSERLRFPRSLRLLLTILVVPLSLQLLPPAWSPASLLTAEFRIQTLALGFCWLLLIGTWFLDPWSLRLRGSLAAGFSFLAASLSAWQFLVVKPSMDAVYGSPPPIGWGFFLCLSGLAAMTALGVVVAIRSVRRQAL